MEWIGGYLIIGLVLLAVLWNRLKIEWKSEEFDTKLLLVATPVFWPFILLIIGVIWLTK